jgi:hypothetical protein
MAMLSELLRFEVSDENGQKIRLDDLGIELLEHDYPPVAHLYFKAKDGAVRLPWAEVMEYDKPGKGITVRNLDAAGTFEDRDLKDEVLLKRDVLDGLIVDLMGRRTTRASDLELLPDDGVLRLRAVDAGLSAMLRRITRGIYRGARRKDLYDWKYVEFLRGDPDAVESGAGYRLRIGRLTAGEIAQLAELLPYLHAAELLTLLPDDKAADALQAMAIERQLQVIEEFDEDQAVELLSRMSPDLATDLVGRLDVALMKKFLNLMSQKQRERIIKLLQYPEDSVGGVMVNNIVCFGRRTEARTAREKLKVHSHNGELISIIFVTESSESAVLVGTVAIRSLLDRDGRTLEDIMDPFVATLNPFEKARDAAYRLIGAQVPAMPVTDPKGFLIGAMTIDAAIGLAVAGDGLRSLKVFA